MNFKADLFFFVVVVVVLVYQDTVLAKGLYMRVRNARHSTGYFQQDMTSPTFHEPALILFFLQASLLDPLDSPLTGYRLQYLVYNDTSTIELPALNT